MIILLMKLSRKLAYSFGAIATAISYQAFSTYIVFFYVDVKKLLPGLAAVGMLIWGIWNAINDPIAGFISDHTRTRFGRRIPYIAICAIPFGIIYFLLWTPPFEAATQMIPLFAYFLIFICIFDGLYTVTVLNWASLFPEMFPKLSERAEVNSYRQTFGMIGLVIGIALPPLIYSGIGWKWMGAIFGTIIAVAFLIALWGSREKKEFSADSPLPLKQALAATFKNRSFLTYVFANLCVQYTFTIILATIPFYAKYVLEVGPQQTTLILLSAFVVAIPMLYVWSRLTVRFGAKRCFMASMFSLMICLIPFLFAKGFMTNLIFAGLVGIGLAGFILIADVLISDVIDEDEIQTGTRREGMYFGVNAFITRFAIGLEAASLGGIFILTRYNPYIFTQTREFLFGLRLLIAGFPILALTLGFGVMLAYPLAGSRLEAMKANLLELHKQKGII